MSKVRLLKTYDTNNALVQLAACKLEKSQFPGTVCRGLHVGDVLVCHLLQNFVTEMYERGFNTDSD